MYRMYIKSLGYYENNPGEFLCDGTESIGGEWDTNLEKFPFAQSDRDKICGKVMRFMGSRWDKRTCYAHVNACGTEMVIWRYDRQCKGDVPFVAVELKPVLSRGPKYNDA